MREMVAARPVGHNQRRRRRSLGASDGGVSIWQSDGVSASLVVSSPLGPLCLRATDGALVAIEFLNRLEVASPPLEHAVGTDTDRVVVAVTARWLEAYFAGRPAVLTVPLRPAGTAFQQRVWTAMASIPWGSTWTYGEVAARVSSVARAVGRAAHENPLPILLPCHRVVGRTGLVGYAAGVERKAWLLRHEGVMLPALHDVSSR
jgi:methylated-DNA-[protein]-cysteine S-methyltransferase